MATTLMPLCRHIALRLKPQSPHIHRHQRQHRNRPSLIMASEKSGRPLFLGSYPITPATDILHELAKRKDLGVKACQMEDEIAGVCSAIGASYGGHLAVTTTSGGLALKSEGIGLAVMAEAPARGDRRAAWRTRQPAFPPKLNRPTSCRLSMAATAKARFAWLPPQAPQTASQWHSRPLASP